MGCVLRVVGGQGDLLIADCEDLEVPNEETFKNTST